MILPPISFHLCSGSLKNIVLQASQAAERHRIHRSVHLYVDHHMQMKRRTKTQ
jgi:hypothetical protein